MKDIYIASAQDLESLSREFGVGTIHVNVKSKRESENIEWEARLNKAVRACGCFEGGAAFFIALTYIFYRFPWQVSDSFLSIITFSNLGLIILALVFGKALGFLRVQIYRYFIIANAKAWIKN